MSHRLVAYDAKVHTIKDLEEAATVKLLPLTRDYYNGGSMYNVTLKDNQTSYDQYRFRPRVLRDVSEVDTSIISMGKKNAFPLGIAPAACHGMAHPDAELGTSRAAAKKGVNMILSTWSNSSLEDVINQGKGETTYCQQINLMKDDTINLSLIKKAEECGYEAVIITVDTPWVGRRLSEFKNPFNLSRFLNFPNFPEMTQKRMLSLDEKHQLKMDLTWEYIKFLKSKTSLKMWIKGIATGEDAALAVEHGMDGIIVSNHGGRQLDGAISTLESLPEVVEAVNGRIPVHIDGGIRSGTDIFKALALGADFCWVGRIPLWGLAYNGEQGVSLALNILHDEFRNTMALAGVTRVEDIGPEHLARVRPAIERVTRKKDKTPSKL